MPQLLSRVSVGSFSGDGNTVVANQAGVTRWTLAVSDRGTSIRTARHWVYTRATNSLLVAARLRNNSLRRYGC